jgi:hypothetical protein
MANSTKTWALLIGIDFYPDPMNRLRGCVNDVEDVQLLLKTRLLNLNLAITKLTASVPTEGATNLPTEQEFELPTIANVKSEFARITDSARSGDSIYVHYSGHGTRRNTTSAYINKSSTQDAALCLYRSGGEDSYLKGFDLAQMLDKLVDKGLTVTVVLDACCSGSITRKGAQDGTDVRGIEWDLAISKPADSATPHRGDRDGGLARHWLLDPQQYALLAACGPNEVATEAMLDGKRRGVLTYNIISLLALPRNHKSNLTFPDLFNQLVAKMHVEAPAQNPMRFGKTDAVFCCKENLQVRLNPSVIDVIDKGSICLNIGRAHGASYDDEYAVYPQHPAKSAENARDLLPIRFKITSVNDVNSIAAPCSPTEAGDLTESKSGIVVGCRAVPLTHFSLRKTHVRVPGEFLEGHQAARDLTRLSLIESESTDCPALYTVQRNSEEEYQVHNAVGEPLSHVPTVPISAQNAQQQVLSIVEHIAKFKFIESLENKNPQSEFENSFEVWMGQNGSKFSDQTGGVMTVKHGDSIEISIKNNGNSILYFSFLNLRPLWEIEPILRHDGQFNCIQPGTQAVTIRLKMKIPESLKSQGEKSISDILKVFITREVARFDVLAMNALGSKPGSDREQRSIASLDDVWSAWASSQRDVELVTIVNKDLWVARNFIIRTSLE